MKALKNKTISEKYRVSKNTVSDWLKAAINGENNLQVEKIRNKHTILDTDHNQAELMRLAERSVK